MEVRVGSIRAGDTGEYIGRPGKGRFGSPLANPYPITNTQHRGAVVTKYRAWLWRRVTGRDQKVLLELGRLLRLALRPEGVTLLCWCHAVGEIVPACHGDVIKAALEWLAEDPVMAAALELGGTIAAIGE